MRELHKTPSQKYFVSDLPFKCDKGGMKCFFKDGLTNVNGNVATAQSWCMSRLFTFEYSKWCKRQVFLMFDSNKGERMVLIMNGLGWKDVEEMETKNMKTNKDGGRGKGGGREKKEF